MSNERETTLAVDGMTCGSCVRHVRDALKEVEGVGAIDVNLAQGKVVVRHDETSAPVPALVEAIRDAGYEVEPAGA